MKTFVVEGRPAGTNENWLQARLVNGKVAFGISGYLPTFHTRENAESWIREAKPKDVEIRIRDLEGM